MGFRKILDRKIRHYGQTEAAYEFAAEEYANKKVIEELESIIVGTDKCIVLTTNKGSLDAFKSLKISVNLRIKELKP
jgi:hypothetical protein